MFREADQIKFSVTVRGGRLNHEPIQMRQSTQMSADADSLKDVPVELFLSVAQKLADHLPT